MSGALEFLFILLFQVINNLSILLIELFLDLALFFGFELVYEINLFVLGFLDLLLEA